MWITQFEFDLLACTCTCVTTSNPERLSDAFRIQFENISHVNVDRYHDHDHRPLGDFTGFRTRDLHDAGRAQYRTDTGDAVVTFEAATNPRIVLVEAHEVPPYTFVSGDEGPGSKA